MEDPFNIPGKANGYALLVAEGNFSFASDFILESYSQVVATCWNQQDLSEVHLQNITFIQKRGGIVYTDVDATHLDKHPIVAKHKYDVIIFNFPHIPGKMNIKKNRKLLYDFFHSAAKILTPKGEIRVTLCKGQGGTPDYGQPRKWSNTWQIVALASSSDLILRDNIPFKCDDYPNYRCTGFRGGKQFNVEGAMTYVFCSGSPIHRDEYVYMDGDIYIDQDVALRTQFCLYATDGFHQISEIMVNTHHPINEVFNKISEESKKICGVELKELTHCTLFCHHDNQHVALCKHNSAMQVFEDCCTNTILKTLLTEAILDLRIKDIFIKNTLCFPCISLPSDFLRVNPCLLLFSKDHYKITSSTKILLNSVIPDSKMDINFSSNYRSSKNFDHFNKIFCDLDRFENPLSYINKPVCEFLSQLWELGLIATNKYCLNWCSLSLFATYSIKVIGGYELYKDIEFIIKDDINGELSESLKIGTFGRLSYNSEDYYYGFLDLARMAMLAFHVFDQRVLYDEHSYYITLKNASQNIFRPLALHSPFYAHDVSFWINTEFSETKFILLVKNVLKNLVFSIQQIDLYFDSMKDQRSVCYRFTYSALSQPLSKEKAREIHGKFRETLKTCLKVSVR